jgi:DNA-binding IclR family transcriptional regulator
MSRHGNARDRPVSQSGPATSTRAVDRALLLLEYVVTASAAPTLAQAARSARLPVSTAARLLATLEGHGLIRRADDARYWPGVRMFQVAAATMRGLPVYELAAEHLEALCGETGESSYLLVPAGTDQAVYLRQMESPSSIRHASWVGRTIPLAGSATGAALAGATGEDGYALNRGAVEPDTATAAAPVYAGDGEIVAAITVIAPSFRVDDDRLNAIGRVVARHANALSLKIGGLRPGSGGDGAMP